MLGLILFLGVIWVISEAVEGIQDIRAIIVPFAQSWYGILITIAVVAWVTYRWYQAKQRCGNDERTEKKQIVNDSENEYERTNENRIQI